MPESSYSKRIISLDIAKALCILLVVVGHFNPDTAPEWWKCVNQIIYSFHMPLFLFVSGYVYHHTLKKQSFGAFMGKKMKRLAVPYFITSVLIIAIKIATQGNAQVEHPVTLHSFIEICYLPAAGYFLWYVWALLMMFLVVWCAQTKATRLCLFAISVALYYLPFEFPEFFCLRQLKVMWLYFMAGVVCSETNLKVLVANARINLLYVALFCITFLLLADAGTPFVPIVACSGILMVIAISKWLEQCPLLASRMLLPIAGVSYTIYLYHTTFMGFAKAVSAKIQLSSMFEAEACFVVICGIIAPFVLHRLLKNCKVGRLILGIR